MRLVTVQSKLLKPNGDPIAKKKITFEAIPYTYSPKAQWSVIPVVVETDDTGFFSVELEAVLPPFPASNYLVEFPDGSPRFVITMPSESLDLNPIDNQNLIGGKEPDVYQLTTLRAAGQVPRKESSIDLIQQAGDSRYVLLTTFETANKFANTPGFPMKVPLTTDETIPYIEARIDERLQRFTGGVPFGEHVLTQEESYHPEKYGLQPGDPDYEEGYDEAHPLANCWVSAALAEDRYQPMGRYYSQSDGDANKTNHDRLKQQVEGIQYSLNNNYASTSALNQLRTDLEKRLNLIVFYNPSASNDEKHPEGALRYSDATNLFLSRSQLYETVQGDEGVLRYVDIKAELVNVSLNTANRIPLGPVKIGDEEPEDNKIPLTFLHSKIITAENIGSYLKKIEDGDLTADQIRLNTVDERSQKNESVQLLAFENRDASPLKLKESVLPTGILKDSDIAAIGAGSGLVNVAFLRDGVKDFIKTSDLETDGANDKSSPITLDYFNANKGDKNEFTQAIAEGLFVPKSEDGTKMDISYLPVEVVQKPEIYSEDPDGNLTVVKFTTLEQVTTEAHRLISAEHTTITGERDKVTDALSAAIKTTQGEVDVLTGYLFVDGEVKPESRQFALKKFEETFYVKESGEIELSRRHFPYTVIHGLREEPAEDYSFKLTDVTYIPNAVRETVGLLSETKPFSEGKLINSFIPSSVAAKDGLYFVDDSDNYTDPKVLTSDHIEGFDDDNPGILKTIKVLADINVVTGVVDTDSFKIVNVGYMARFFPGATPKLKTSLFPYEIAGANTDPDTVSDEALVNVGYAKKLKPKNSGGLKLQVRDWDPNRGLRAEDDFVIFRVKANSEISIPDPPREGFYFELINWQSEQVPITGDFIGDRTSAILIGGKGESVGLTAITTTEWRIEGRYN
ncbi:MAG: hypothetical protein F6K53_20095 [Moorea sp. SIO4A1]|uniref:hypothetical protein n=1 Tax=Moorena sp. SIO4A1 TaxID=2607835 RepID=UPI00144DEAE7|nr:hypothetical protein [Moorena sp. SIO4A1]NEQ59573.1 hypothetical protein [Moorena sp. SIO4A1]